MASDPTDTPRPAAPAPHPSGSTVPRMRRVFVHGLEIVTSIGILERERRYEQRIIVSVDLDVRDDYNGRSDRIGHVLDYARLVDTIERLIQSEHVNLLETLAERVAESCLADARVLVARVRIEKPDAIASVRSVGIEIVRCRGD